MRLAAIIALLCAAPALADESVTIDAPVYRFVMVESDLDAKAVSLAINLVSTSPTIVAPMLQGNLVRIDLRDYAANAADLKRLVETWEELRFDPAFITFRVDEDGTVFILDCLHDPALVEQLGTQAPVVECGYFLTRSLSTVKEQHGNATIFGGLYYEFAGVSKTEKDVIKSLGIDPGDDLLVYFDRLPSQLRVAMEKSGVSGKPRRIDWLATAVRFGGSYAATRDMKEGKQGGARDPLESIAKMVVEAVEAIYTRPNGLPGYALFNGEGQRQDSAPPDVVVADQYLDRDGKRNPHSTTLQMPLCIDCHWKGDNRGLIPFTNDVLLQARAGIKVLDPLLVRLYRGDPDLEGGEMKQLLVHSRHDLVKAVLLTSAIGKQPGWPGGKGDQLDIVSLAGAYVVQRYRSYVYEPIDARDALRELRVAEIPEKLPEAVEALNALVPTASGEKLPLVRLRKGFQVNRFQWSQVRADAYKRRQLKGAREP